MAQLRLPERTSSASVSALALSAVVSALVLMPGCGRTTLRGTPGPTSTFDAGPDDGAIQRDTGIHEGGLRDAPETGPRDGGPCDSDDECNDGVICNGVERCSPGGCVDGDPVRCESDTCTSGFCDEAAGGCVRVLRDADGDGFASTLCGGGDCDDTNALVSPIALESCTGGLDEDCDSLADCADMDCAPQPVCMMTGRCPDREVGSAVGILSRGTTVGAGGDSTGTCRDSNISQDLAFRWIAPAAGTYVFDTRGSTYDTVLYARAGSCSGPELACDDDGGGGLASLIRLPLGAGDVVVLFVDGFGGQSGNYVLTVTREEGAEICGNGVDDDRDGLTDCGDPDCAGSPTCCAPVSELCDNGTDDDCDSAIDCSDPDCVAAPACCLPSPESCTNGRDDDCDRQTDCSDPDCAASPSCCVPRPEVCGNGADDDCDMLVDCADPSCVSAPVCCAMRAELCANGADDDCDGRIDCMDPDCTIDPVCLPTCPERDLGSMTGASIATGTTVGAGNDQMASCGGRATGQDVTFGWTAPRTATYVFDTIGSSFDTVLHLHDGSCTGPELACDDDGGGSSRSRITLTVRGGTRIVIVVDGFGMFAGSFVLNVRPVANETGRCADGIDNDADGFIDCVDSDCASEPTCCVPVPEICTDGVDNDCDRVTDCADPNCRTSPACCMAAPESCTNFADDDCDGFVDCVDSDCAGRPPC